jgi:FkbM family methyltransferase
MNNIARNGVSIKIAFLSNLKQKMPHESMHKDIPESEQIQHLFWFKKILRPIVGYIYRFLKPALRPIAFRVRRYLIDDLRQQIQQEIQRASAATAQQIQQEVQRASAATAQQIQQEVQRASAATAQQIQQEVQRASAATAQQIQQEVQRASAATLSNNQQLASVLLPRLDLIDQYSAVTARRVAMNCGAGEVLVKTEVGFLLCAATDHALLSCLLETGELERGTRILIQKYLKPGNVFIDVGANVGMHTLAAARAMQGQGKIIAFEPFEPTMRMLEKSIWMNGFSSMTEIHQAAVSNAAGRQQLFIGATSGHHSLFALEPSPNNAQGPVEVPLVRLDSVIAAGQRIDLMKIDVEGAELEVIEGAVSLIADNPEIALIVEFGPSHLRRTGRTPSQWLDAFNQLGLYYRVINNESGALEEWSLDALEQVESVNLIFSRPESPAWERLS